MRTIRCLGIFTLLLLAATADATVVTNTTCGLTIGGGTSVQQMDPTSCSVSLSTPQGGGLASATVSNVLTGPTNATPSSSVSLTLTADAFASPAASALVQVSGFATAFVNGSLPLYTAGPVRQGEIQYSESINLTGAADPPDVDNASLGVGSLQATCGGGRLSGIPFCTGNLGPSNGNVPSATQPFTLGQVFMFSEGLNIQSNSTAFGNVESGDSEVIFNFQILDANGVPVQIFAVPEPASLVLLTCGAAVLLMFSRKRRSLRL